MVTCAAGSLGTEFVCALLQFNPLDLVLIDDRGGAADTLEQDLHQSGFQLLTNLKEEKGLNPFSRVSISFG